MERLEHSTNFWDQQIGYSQLLALQNLEQTFCFNQCVEIALRLQISVFQNWLTCKITVMWWNVTSNVRMGCKGGFFGIYVSILAFRWVPSRKKFASITT